MRHEQLFSFLIAISSSTSRSRNHHVTIWKMSYLILRNIKQLSVLSGPYTQVLKTKNVCRVLDAFCKHLPQWVWYWLPVPASIRWQAIPVQPVWRLIHPEGKPAATHQAAHRRKTLQMPLLQLRLPATRCSHWSFAHSCWYDSSSPSSFPFFTHPPLLPRTEVLSYIESASEIWRKIK